MDEHGAILLQDFIQQARKLKFQEKKEMKQGYINWVAHRAKRYIHQKIALVQLSFVIRKYN